MDMSKPSSPKPSSPEVKLEVEVRRGPLEEPTMVTVLIDRSTMESLPYRGGFKDIRTGRYIISEHFSNTTDNIVVCVL